LGDRWVRPIKYKGTISSAGMDLIVDSLQCAEVHFVISMSSLAEDGNFFHFDRGPPLMKSGFGEWSPQELTAMKLPLQHVESASS
jgi:hypothetical protein